jgi:putative oxidoreductase
MVFFSQKEYKLILTLKSRRFSMCSFLFLLGRICMSAIFILAGVSKFLEYDQTVAFMASKGLPMIPALLIGAAIVEILGGLSILLGYRARWGALLLILFLIPTTLIFHNFWTYTDQEQKLQMIHFFSNLAIIGGLLFVVGAGPGSCSVGQGCCTRK